jgi:hypothetical protein
MEKNACSKPTVVTWMHMRLRTNSQRRYFEKSNKASNGMQRQPDYAQSGGAGGRCYGPAEGVAVAVAAAEAATNARLQAADSLGLGMCMDAKQREHINTDLRHQLPRF